MIKKILLLILFLTIVIAFFWLYSSSVTKNMDSYVYNLPYKEGTSHKVVQGYGGMFSHWHKAALDFLMPIGTPIFAAREGTIYAYKENNNENGFTTKYKDKANFIIIKHTDGSYGCYWHLMQNGVVAKQGYVQKGALIGYSGNTGQAIQPHLHFAVKRKLNYDENAFVQTKFFTTKGIQLLQRGSSYERP